MAFWKTFKGFWDPVARAEATVETQVSTYVSCRLAHPERDPNAWLALTLQSRLGWIGRDDSWYYLQAAQFSVLPNELPPVALGLFVLNREEPELAARYEVRFTELMAPVRELIDRGEFPEVWQAKNPWTATHHPNVGEVIFRAFHPPTFQDADTSGVLRHYEVLGVGPDASLDEVRHAYRDLVKVWHPDRFVGDQHLQDKAKSKLQEVNEAYRSLCAVLGHATQRSVSPTEAGMTCDDLPTESGAPTEATTENVDSEPPPFSGNSPKPAQSARRWIWVTFVLLLGGLHLLPNLREPPQKRGFFDAPESQSNNPEIEPGSSRGHPASRPTRVATPNARRERLEPGLGFVEVLQLLGQPSAAIIGGSNRQTIWYYGSSRLVFENGQVTSWDDAGELSASVVVAPEPHSAPSRPQTTSPPARSADPLTSKEGALRTLRHNSYNGNQPPSSPEDGWQRDPNRRLRDPEPKPVIVLTDGRRIEGVLQKYEKGLAHILIPKGRASMLVTVPESLVDKDATARALAATPDAANGATQEND